MTEISIELSTLTEFRSVDWTLVPNTPGVYVIWDGSEVVYVVMAGRNGGGGLRNRLRELRAKEDLAIVRGLGSLAFVRGQGRTLEGKSQEKVLELLWIVRCDLEAIGSRDEFDHRHHEWVGRVIQALRTNRQSPLAYGQGQKTINVFLKFYVDWASRPSAQIAARLRPWLHCPLDKVVMEALRSHDTEGWRHRIWEPFYRGRINHQQRASMSSITEATYRAWQLWIRELSPDKPILLDALWSLMRPMDTNESNPPN
jgi:hypothetical protein